MPAWIHCPVWMPTQSVATSAVGCDDDRERGVLGEQQATQLRRLVERSEDACPIGRQGVGGRHVGQHPRCQAQRERERAGQSSEPRVRHEPPQQEQQDRVARDDDGDLVGLAKGALQVAADGCGQRRGIDAEQLGDLLERRPPRCCQALPTDPLSGVGVPSSPRPSRHRRRGPGSRRSPGRAASTRAAMSTPMAPGVSPATSRARARTTPTARMAWRFAATKRVNTPAAVTLGRGRRRRSASRADLHAALPGPSSTATRAMMSPAVMPARRLRRR